MAEQVEPKAITYHIHRCPYCNSRNIRVQVTKAPIRYHKCHDCGNCFKSVESDEVHAIDPAT